MSAFAECPGLARHVVAVIEYWAKAEAELAALLVTLLKADYRVAHAMYNALSSSEARRAALTGAAREALNVEDFELYESVMRAIAPSRNTRNAFAHRLWGFSPDLPRALLLTDSSWEAETWIVARQLGDKVRENVRNGRDPDEGVVLSPTDYSRILVYRENELEREATNAQRAGLWVYRLRQCLGDRALRHYTAIRSKLSNELATVLTHQPKSRKRTP